MTTRFIVAAAATLAFPLAMAAQPALPAAQAEIDHLLAYIAQSNCRFNRNGSWHGMEEARDHIAMKYKYLRDRDKVADAETFIDEAASRSSFSGKDYLVECPGHTATPSAGWLKAELARFRKAAKG
jgi:hypothetical protein